MQQLQEFLQQMINGLSLGAIYALIAVGYTMVYGVLQLINFAHGDVFMVGAMLTLVSARRLHFVQGNNLTQSWWAFILCAGIAIVFCGVLGFVIERDTRGQDLYRAVAIPWWAVTALLAIAPSVTIWRWAGRRNQRMLGLCEVCGYDLRASHERCPECGTAIPDRRATMVALMPC